MIAKPSKLLLLLTIATCLLASGCQDDSAKTTWSAETKSPDGDWLAIARSQQWSGPGNAYDATTVSLKRTSGDTTPIKVLDFDHDYATMDINMKWLTPTHLEVMYGASSLPGDHVNVNFQAIRCAGIDISLRDISSDTSSASP
jgi:hypothetical protein